MTDPAPKQEYDLSADSVAAEAFDEVRFLCRQRMDTRSADLASPDLTRFEQRLDAYVDVLVVRGKPVLEWLAKALPGAESAADACGMALILLASQDRPAAQSVFAAIEAAQEPQLVYALNYALGRIPSGHVLSSLEKSFASGPAKQAAAAAETLALQGKLNAREERLTQLLADEDPLVRRQAWRAAALAG